MRTLLAKDIAPFTKILAKMDLRESIKSMFAVSRKDKGENKEENGKMVSELICGIIENYHKAEKDLFSFVADLEGKTEDEIAKLPLPEFIGIITELIGEKNLSFFKLAAK